MSEPSSAGSSRYRSTREPVVDLRAKLLRNRSIAQAAKGCVVRSLCGGEGQNRTVDTTIFSHVRGPFQRFLGRFTSVESDYLLRTVIIFVFHPCSAQPRDCHPIGYPSVTPECCSGMDGDGDMPTRKFAAQTVQSLKAQSHRVDYFDALTPGFGLRDYERYEDLGLSCPRERKAATALDDWALSGYLARRRAKEDEDCGRRPRRKWR